MAIVTFEDFTEDLSEEEMKYLPIVVEAISKLTEPTKSDEVITTIQHLYFKKEESHLPMSGPRLRKFVNHIRTRHLLPVIATSKGYFVSRNKETIQMQILSMQQRAHSQLAAANGLKHFIDNENA